MRAGKQTSWVLKVDTFINLASRYTDASPYSIARGLLSVSLVAFIQSTMLAPSDRILAVEPEQMCRICLGSEGEDFISPCLCKGSVMYVHRSCWNRWRMISKNPMSYYRCENCHFFYNLSQDQDLDRALESVKGLDGHGQEINRNCFSIPTTIKLLLVYSLSLFLVLLPLWTIGACTTRILARRGHNFDKDNVFLQLLWGTFVLGGTTGLYFIAKGLIWFCRSFWHNEGVAAIAALTLFYILFCM